MTRAADREKARTLRAKGKSYSEIRHVLNVPKGTLSDWLKDMPLTVEQIRQLRDLNPKRIERFRETMRRKREIKLEAAYVRAKKDIGVLSKRDIFIAGLYLYWGEGLKATSSTVGFANTDPAAIKAFLHWLHYMDVPMDKIRIRLHLYTDMNQAKEIRYWSKTLHIPIASFRKPHVKKTLLSSITYLRGFGHGTCEVLYDSVEMKSYVTTALTYLREQHMHIQHGPGDKQRTM